MIEWIVIGLVLSLVSGVGLVPYFLLFEPWRVRRLAYFLAARWPWYRRRIWLLAVRRMTRVTVKFTASVAGVVEPMKRIGRAIEDMHRALAKAG